MGTISRAGTGRDGTGWDETGRAGTGWDGTGWDETGRDGTKRKDRFERFLIWKKFGRLGLVFSRNDRSVVSVCSGDVDISEWMFIQVVIWRYRG